MELILFLVTVFIGAAVGVVWPPKSPTWSRWQKGGIVLGVSAVATFAILFGVAYFHGWDSTAWWLLAIACLLTVGYMIIGNVCRAFHESAKEDNHVEIEH